MVLKDCKDGNKETIEEAFAVVLNRLRVTCLEIMTKEMGERGIFSILEVRWR